MNLLQEINTLHPCSWFKPGDISALAGKKTFYLIFSLIFLIQIQTPTTILAENIRTINPAIKKGIKKYKEQEFEESISILQNSISENSDDWEIPLYIGLNYLQLKQYDRAISSFKQFLALNPDPAMAREIRGYLTLLKKKSQRKQAENLLSTKPPMVLDKHTNKTLAVHTFANIGSPEYDAIARGLAVMIIHDLHQEGSFRIVERIQIQALYNELELNNSELVDKQFSLMSGRLLQAGFIIPGKYQVDNNRLNIDSSIMETKIGNSIGNISTSGELPQFFQLEKMIVFSILQQLGINRNNISQEKLLLIDHIHTKNLKAFTAFSQGIAASDLDDYQEARRQFKIALKEDKNFTLAEKALSLLPQAALAITAIISEIESSASELVSSTSTTTATGSSSVTAATSGGATTGGGAAGLSTSTLTIAATGTALAGGAVVASSSMSQQESAPVTSSSNDSSAEQDISIIGVWKGLASEGDTIEQRYYSNGKYTGINDQGVKIAGSYSTSGNTVSMSYTGPNGPGTMTALVMGKTMTGTWHESNDDISGSFTLTKISDTP